MSDIKVSIFGSWAYPKIWPAFFEQLEMNKVCYEIVICSPEWPDYTLPSNVKFIHVWTDPGVCKCAQIAASACSGETMMLSPDDLVFTPYALDMLYEKYKEEGDYKCMVHARLGSPGNDITEMESVDSLAVADSPLRFGYAALWSRQVFLEIGGLDAQYNAGPYDLDAQIRIYNSGGRFVYAPDAYVSENKSLQKTLTNSAWYRFGANQEVKEILYKRWYSNGVAKGGVLLPTPLTPFMPIDEVKLSRFISG